MSESKDLNPPKIIQITAAASVEGSYLYALDEEGNVYVRVVKMSGEFWRKINDQRIGL